jgi:hypothetical protein
MSQARIIPNALRMALECIGCTSGIYVSVFYAAVHASGTNRRMNVSSITRQCHSTYRKFGGDAVADVER